MLSSDRHRTRQTAQADGFTLVELLIVILVLGVLAAIVVFAVGRTREDAVANSCKTNYAEIVRSAQAVDVKTGAYPVYTWTTSSTDATNPLVFGTADNGALLTTYPVREQYRLVYSATTGDDYTITVQDKNGTAVAQDATTRTGCDSL
jgi:prepilin-type N-terminal cleavage/methylation domain-containing protein